MPLQLLMQNSARLRLPVRGVGDVKAAAAGLEKKFPGVVSEAKVLRAVCVAEFSTGW